MVQRSYGRLVGDKLHLPLSRDIPLACMYFLFSAIVYCFSHFYFIRLFHDNHVLMAHRCHARFHPQGRLVGTTSFDNTWRLWDIASGGQCVLEQQGHAYPTYGIAFHVRPLFLSILRFASGSIPDLFAKWMFFFFLSSLRL
jgi:hypothetical protein